MLTFETHPPLHWKSSLEEPELRTPKNGRASSRWTSLTKVGIKSPVTGQRVRLKFVRLPHGPHTHRGAIEDFIRELNGAAPVAAAASLTTADAALKELADAGYAA